MQYRGFKDAAEDARGVLAIFAEQTVADEDCVSEVRDAIKNLDAAIDVALRRTRGRELDPGDRTVVEGRARELILLWDKCGPKTQALVLDLRTLFGRYLTLR